MTQTPYSPPVDSTTNRTRWRLIPAGLLFVFGCLAAPVAALSLTIFLVQDLPAPVEKPRYIAGMLLLMACGGTCAYAGKCLWKQQRRASMTVTAVAIGLYVGALIALSGT